MSNPAPDDGRPAAEETNASLMQQMLEATLARREGSLSENEWTILRRVASEAQSRGAGTVEFVESLIWELCGLRFPKIQQDTVTCKRMCLRIAATLAADPHARKRLNEFQQHLLQPK